MDCQIDEKTAHDRFDRLLEVLNSGIHEIHSKLLGTTVNVLVEEVSRQDEDIVSGRSEHNSLVHFKGDSSLIGKTVPVKITENKTFYLMGERI